MTTTGASASVASRGVFNDGDTGRESGVEGGNMRGRESCGILIQPAVL